MAVNLSLLGGVAAQFFDNNGVPLSGGFLYTYAAGTSTPQAVYTSSNGGTPQANPIVLDSSGRVPSGEIWLTDGSQYKFVLQNANAVLIGTYDNIIGINSNFVNYTNQQEIQTATASQTVFTLTTMQYQPGSGSLSVFVDGVNQYGPSAQYAYTETSSTVITFVNGLHVGASVKFTTSAINASSYGNSSQISYTPAGTGAVATNVQTKLRQYVSVTDFGAVGDGTTNDTVAFANAIAYLDTTGGGQLYIPDGIYMLDSLTMTGRSKALVGETMGSPTLTHGVVLRCRSACSDFVTISGVAHRIENMFIDGNGLASAAVVRYTNNMTDVVTSNIIIAGGVSGGILLALAASPQNNNAQISELKFYGVLLAGDTGVTNLYINSDQAVVIAFYNLKSFNGNYGIDLVRGTVTLYCPFFTANLVYDIRAVRGQVTIFDGRSESSTINSLSFTGSTNFELNSYVHGSTITQTTLELPAGWTGYGVVVGGQYTNILNSSPTGTLVLVNQVLYSGGAFYGAYAYKSINISGGYLRAPKLVSFVNVLAYSGTVSPDMGVADRQYVAVTDAGNFIIAAPANPTAYQTMYLTISNQSGGAMGVITWNAIYKLGAFTKPATGFQRTISFFYDGANWLETFRSSNDVPN